MNTTAASQKVADPPHCLSSPRCSLSRILPKLLVLASVSLSVMTGCNRPPRKEPKKNAVLPASSLETVAWKVADQVPSRGFLGSEACRRCHARSHESWHSSFHRTMTQVASAAAIQAPFDGRKLTRGTVTCTVERRGDAFWVRAPDPDIDYRLFQEGAPSSYSPPIVERKVALVTGSHHMQIYWLPSNRGNELRIFPWVFSIDEQRWIPYEDSFVTPATHRRMRASWNANCIACHSVDGKPNYDLDEKRFQTEVVEYGISCEACHGPGESHVRWQEDPQLPAAKGTDPIVHPGQVPSKVAAEICGQCHSDFTRDESYYVHGPRYRAGEDLNAAQSTIDFQARKDPRHPFHDSHWEDGTGRVGGREYLGLTASKCFQEGELTCITCHSMHNADPNQQLSLSAQHNDVCTKCHDKIAQDISAHTHHAADSSGSECYNCHMPRTSFALLRAIRSHRVDSPNAATSHATGRPNACNLCHLDKSLSWTASTLKDWYGTEQPAWNTAEQVPIAASVEWLLRGDAAQRIVTAWHYSWQPAQEASGDEWQTPLLAQLLNDTYSAVRLVAGRSLKTLPNMGDLKYDFLASEADRKAAILSAIDDWRSSSRSLVNDPAAVLQNEDGLLDEPTIRTLLEKQDRRNISLTE
jgi:predicted CXXCH cytochrome family protein